MFIRYNVLILLMPAITFLHVQNIQILEMYFAKQYKIFLIVTISLLLYGSPDHGLNFNTEIFEAVHTYI